MRKDLKLTWPRAETATDYITYAAEPDLMVATKTAIQEMIDFLVATRKLTRHRAYQLVSIAGNVAMTQLVDLPNYGVHVKMPKSIFTSAPAAAPARPAAPAPARPAAPAPARPARRARRADHGAAARATSRRGAISG